LHGPLTPAAATSQRVDVALDATFYVAAAALALLVVVLGPLATNDGPVHVSFARLLATLGTPDHPVQSAVYERNDAPPTNAAVYAVLGLLLRFVRRPPGQEQDLEGGAQTSVHIGEALMI
jgi:hypothetical protein